MIDWKRKLTSRKFWLAVALFVSGVFTAIGREEQGKTVYGLIMQAAAVVAYVIGEGLADAANNGVEYDVTVETDSSSDNLTERQNQ